MRRAASLTAALVLALSLVGEARAASLPFSGTLSIEIASLPPIVVARAGSVSLNGSGGLGPLASLALAGGTFASAQSVPVTDPVAAPIKGVLLAVTNGPGSFALGGQMALPGSVTLCLFAACPAPAIANVSVPFTSGGTRGVGLGGGTVTSMGAVNVSVTGAPWTTGTAVVPYGHTRMGFVHGPASAGASSAANVGGVLQLVTPIRIDTNLGVDGPTPAFATLRLEFVPEPATLLLTSVGALGLGVLGRCRAPRAPASRVEPYQGR